MELIELMAAIITALVALCAYLLKLAIVNPIGNMENPDKNVVGWQWSEHEYIGDTEVDMNEWYEEI